MFKWDACLVTWLTNMPCSNVLCLTNMACPNYMPKWDAHNTKNQQNAVLMQMDENQYGPGFMNTWHFGSKIIKSWLKVTDFFTSQKRTKNHIKLRGLFCKYCVGLPLYFFSPTFPLLAALLMLCPSPLLLSNQLATVLTKLLQLNLMFYFWQLHCRLSNAIVRTCPMHRLLHRRV